MAQPTPDEPTAGPASPLSALIADVAARGQERALGLVLGAIEHLLRQQSWAREKLRMHAGLTVRLGVDAPPPPGLPPAELRATIDEEGQLRLAAADVPPAATLLLKPSADVLFTVLREGPDGLARHLRLDGDVALARTLGELARHLRWDAEEDLSRLTGDVLAHRIARFAGEGFGRLRELRARVESAAAQFVATDRHPLGTRRQLDAVRDGAIALDQRLSRLEARTARLPPRS